MKIYIEGENIEITTSDRMTFRLQYCYINEISHALEIIRAVREKAVIGKLNVELQEGRIGDGV